MQAHTQARAPNGVQTANADSRRAPLSQLVDVLLHETFDSPAGFTTSNVDGPVPFFSDGLSDYFGINWGSTMAKVQARSPASVARALLPPMTVLCLPFNGGDVSLFGVGGTKLHGLSPGADVSSIN